MNKSTSIIVVFLIVALLAFVIVPVWLGGGWGMMDPGMMGWGFGPLAWLAVPLFWLGLIALALLSLTWSTRTLRGTKPKYCPSCGCEVLTGARFCSNCGKSLPK